MDVVSSGNNFKYTIISITIKYVKYYFFMIFFSYKVRLGLYNTKQDITCVVESNIQECSDPIVEINVEKEMYTNKKGEIALLRLVEGVTYSGRIGESLDRTAFY